MIVILPLLLVEMYDHLPNPWKSLPEVVIPKQNGWRVIIIVPPSSYKSAHSISVSDVEM